MNPGDPSPFYSFDPMVFQELCRDLLEVEDGIRTCEIYGVTGQSQSGIDLLAYTDDGNAVEVGQCKCSVNLKPGEIREAANDFLEHLDLWRGRGVRKYILFVASPLGRREQQDEIARQTKRFAEVGIVFEPWSSRTIRTKLSPHPEIVWRYTRSEEWVKAICGPGRQGQSPEGAASRSRLEMERELEELKFFDRLFGFQDRREVRDAVMRVYCASKRIGRRAFKDASACLSEEAGWPKVSISKARHVLSILGCVLSVMFFILGAALHPVLWEGRVSFRDLTEMFIYSMVSMGMYWLTLTLVVNPYVQALRIKKEVDRLRRA